MVGKGICLALFFAPLALYLFRSWVQLLERPQTLDVGVIAVAAVLAGLMLNAGIKLVGSNREVTIQVALKFIAVVILMILFGPSIYAIELLGGIDISSLELNSTDAWVRWFMFLIAALSFYVGTGLFIVALVDMAFVLFRISRKGSSSWAMR